MTILAMDLSLNCPGFAVLSISDRTVTLIAKNTVNNSKDAAKPAERRKSTGQKLQEIAMRMHALILKYKPDVIVRERAFSRFNGSTQALFRVVGVSDLMAYDAAHQETAIKMILTGKGKAEKGEVAKALRPYIGDQLYETQDESDAIAAGITWAVQENLIDQKLTPDAAKHVRQMKKRARKKKESKQKVSRVFVKKNRVYH